MKIAIAYDAGLVCPHFGHAPAFKVYTAEEKKVLAVQVVPAMGGGHGAMAALLGQLAADVVICGGIGAPAVAALQAAGMQVYPNVQGLADDALLAYLNGTLAYDPTPHNCHGHDGAHHEDGHHCCH